MSPHHGKNGREIATPTKTWCRCPRESSAGILVIPGEACLSARTHGVIDVTGQVLPSSSISLLPLMMRGLNGTGRRSCRNSLSALIDPLYAPPFQCDVCWFYNLCKLAPDPVSQSDHKLLVYIRQVSLDLFWSRAPGKGKVAVTVFRKSIRIAKELTINGRLCVRYRRATLFGDR